MVGGHVLRPAPLTSPSPPPLPQQQSMCPTSSDAGSFLDRFTPTFVDYLNNVVGPRFEPPINFVLEAMNGEAARNAIAFGQVDFAFLHPISASCAVARSNGEANAIVTMSQESGGKAAISLAVASCCCAGLASSRTWQQPTLELMSHSCTTRHQSSTIWWRHHCARRSA